MTRPARPEPHPAAPTDRRAVLCAGAGLLVAGLATSPALARTVVEPGRGTALRRQILAALRPRVERDLGPPIEFVVRQMRVAGDVCFTQVMCQRPGGRPIDLARTPLARRQELGLIDGTRTEAFLFRTGGRWQVEDYSVGSTDVWWSDPRFCPRYSTVLPGEMCR